MPRNNQRSRNNNPEGRNQYSSDWMSTARDRPAATAAVAAAAVGAGVFLWSRRDQISNQLTQLSDQIGQLTENRQTERLAQEPEFETADSFEVADTSTTRTRGRCGNPQSGL